MSRYMQLEFPPELGSGARLGGKFTGPYNGTMAIWKGRPPNLTSGDIYNPVALQISCKGGTIGSTVTIEVEAGNAWGGVTTRKFQVGEGLSVQMQAGAFAHINCRAVTPLEAGQDLFFSWTADPVNKSDLFQYYRYETDGLASIVASTVGTILGPVTPGTTVTLEDTDGTIVNFVAVAGAPGPNEFDVTGTLEDVSSNLCNAINANGFLITATPDGDKFVLEQKVGGEIGNGLTASSSLPAEIAITDFSGGENNKVNLPEGCIGIITEASSNLVFQMPQFGTTFTKSAIAGNEVEAIWGAFSSNVSQNIIFKLRGL